MWRHRCFHVHVIAVAFERHRESFERELGDYVRVDERGGGISVLIIHGREEDCDCPRRMRVSSRYEPPSSSWPLLISQLVSEATATRSPSVSQSEGLDRDVGAVVHALTLPALHRPRVRGNPNCDPQSFGPWT